ncbi:MAG: ATP-binding protein [Planctomycetota bacterium]|nr:ATP-binding protein [Planctomycetota bacterium]
MKIRTFRSKLFLAMGSVILTSIVLSVVTASRIIWQFAQSEIARNLEDGKRAYFEFVELQRKLLQDGARSVAETPYLKATLNIPDVDRETVSIVARMVHEVTETPLTFLLDPSGNLLADAADPERDIRSLRSIAGVEAAISGQEFFGVWPLDGDYFMVAVTPVVAGEQVVGILALGLPVDDAMAEVFRKVTGRDILIFDEKRVVAVAWQGDSKSAVSWEEFSDLRSRLGSTTTPDEDKSFQVTLAGVERLGCPIPFGESDLTLVLSRALGEITGLYYSLNYWLVLVGAVVGLLAILVSQYISKKLTRPIRQLNDASRALTRGDFSKRVEVTTEDELGLLSISFNKMALQIQTLLNDLRASAVRAEAANRAKSQFLANMSHEIRTPLNAILGFANLLHENADSDEEERRDWLRTIRRSGKHLLKLINDVLDISKIEAGHVEVDHVVCTPHAIIGEVVSMLRSRAVEKGLSLELHYDSSMPAMITSDPTRLRQILTNLVGNAVKFTDRGQVRLNVRLVGEGEDSRLRISITDTGVGIPEEQQEAIFDPFVQADTSVTREFGGTGLGLAIAKRIAEALGGSITVESRVGEGTTFVLEVETGSLDGVEMISDPMSESVIEVNAPKTPAGPRLHGRILLVEDGETNRKLIRLVLRRAGAEVVLAENGKIGVEKATSEKFDVILMDMQMPVMDGYTATRTLREQGITTPIIALTAHAMRGDDEKCKAAGCVGYLTKPVEPGLLTSTVAELLDPDAGDGPSESAGSTEESAPSSTRLVSSLPLDDPEFREIVEEFVETLHEKLQEIRHAWETRNFDGLARLAHWLKGAGGTAGFHEFTKPAARFEWLAREKDESKLEEAIARLEELTERIVLEPAEA